MGVALSHRSFSVSLPLLPSLEINGKCPGEDYRQQQRPKPEGRGQRPCQALALTGETTQVRPALP